MFTYLRRVGGVNVRVIAKLSERMRDFLHEEFIRVIACEYTTVLGVIGMC